MSASEIPVITGPGDFNIQVVGESNYQKQIAKVCGKPSRDGVNVEMRAHLILENSNKYDDKAVMVSLGGGTVGYLDRSTAREFRAAVIAGDLSAYTAFQCDALIRGGWDRGDGDKGLYGIRLDLPEDDD